jgi:nitroreductase
MPGMQTWEAIRSRRNIRSFQEKPVADDHLNEILEAGRRAPSSRNWQPWDFIAVTDRDLLGRLAKAGPGAGPVAQSAASIAIIAQSLPDSAQARQHTRLWYDLGQVTMSMLIAATGLGIGSGHAGVADQDLARELLGFPADRFCAFLIPIGYPAGRPLGLIRHPDRKAFDEVVHRERW